MNTEQAMRGKSGLREDLSDFDVDAKSTGNMDFSLPNLAENGARQSARSKQPQLAHPDLPELGEPITISEVARLLGCSEWTIRQRLIPMGLPCLRLRPTGKLMFFHNQIVAWVLERQRQKGTTL